MMYRCLLFFLFFTCLKANSLTAQNATTKVKHVVLIGIDGMGTYGVQKAHTPVMDNLMKTGTYTLAAQAVMPTKSSPNWASMIMGVSPEKHGVLSNGWKRKDIVDKSYCGGEKGNTYPTIFKVIRQAMPKATIASFYDWADFGRLQEDGINNEKVSSKNKRKTLKLGSQYLQKEQPTFTFLHFDHVDHSGHAFGYKSKRYYCAIEKADAIVDKLVKSIEAAGMMDETVIIVTADHGGIGHNHGGNTPEELNIPLIIYGTGIKANKELSQVINIFDIAPTIAHLLGITPPDCWEGKNILK